MARKEANVQREAAKAMAGLVGAVERQDTSQPHAQKAAGTEFYKESMKRKTTETLPVHESDEAKQA